MNPKSIGLQLFNSSVKYDVIIATEMILAYKLKSILKDEIIIGIPNIISKLETINVSKTLNINKIYVVMDFHTMANSPVSAIEHLCSYYGDDKVINCFSLRNCEIPNEIIKQFLNNKIKKDVAQEV